MQNTFFFIYKLKTQQAWFKIESFGQNISTGFLSKYSSQQSWLSAVVSWCLVW